MAAGAAGATGASRARGRTGCGGGGAGPAFAACLRPTAVTVAVPLAPRRGLTRGATPTACRMVRKRAWLQQISCGQAP